MSRYLLQALGATGLVVAAPIVAVWALRAWQVVGSTALAVGIGVILSLAVSFAGSAYWANRDSSRDVLFSELMIWGWLRRWRAEHKLTAALEHLEELTTTASVAREGTPQLAMLTELAEALEAGDPYTRNHSRRVARYASMVAERLGLPADEVDRIRTAAMVHDVGKVQTPIEVLHKPGRLTDEEYAIVKAHPVDGAHLVEALGDDRLTAIVRHHHERLDGRGYPDGLSGEEIPLGARIVAVADTFDAITSARAYRPASPHRKALDILTKEAGTQLDADAVRAFRACYTGRRPFALWMTLLAFPQRLSTSLGNGTTAASAASIPKVVMAASTVAFVGGAAASTRSLMIVPEVPQAAATVAASAAPHPHAQRAVATGTVSVPAALGAKLTSPSVHLREQKLLRAPGNLSRRFPASPAVAHHVAPSSSHTSSAPQSTSSASAPSSSVAPVTSAASSAPVSTVASVPAPTIPTPTATAPTRSGIGKGTANKSTKDHGKGSGGAGKGSDTGAKGSGESGKGSGNSGKGSGKSGKGSGAAGKGTTKTKTTSPTTTTTPGVNPTGKGNGNGNGNGNTTGTGTGKATGTGNGNGNGTTASTGNGKATTGAGGNGTAKAAGNGNGNGSAATGNGSTGTGNGKGTGSSGTTGTGAGTTGTGTGTTGTGTGTTGTGTGTTGTTGTTDTGTGATGTGTTGNAGGNGNGKGHVGL